MAKHLGTRPPSRLRLPLGVRGLSWGAGALLVVTAVTGGLVVRGMAAGGATDALEPTAGHGTEVSFQAARPPAGSSAHARGHAAAHRVDVSRHSDRPKVSPYRVQAGPRLGLRPAVLLARKVASLSPAHATFTIAQSNVLGSQHTAGKGGFGPGTYRAGLTASLLQSHGADVGGMEEVQSDQLAVFLRRMPAYSFWPAASLGHNGERLQIYWKRDQFTMEQSGSVTYVFASQHIPLPYVLLRDNATGAEFWVIAAHNSAGNLQAQRDESTTIEINLINHLRATTHLPVIIVGDMNEHTEFFCRVSTATGMVAANGGSGAGGCHLPPPPLRVDWIMGGGGVSFSGYYQSAQGLGRASDHYYLYSQVTTTSDWFPAGSTPSTSP